MAIPKEGEVYDKRGIPIYRGDLVRSFHFTGARRKRYYLYHVAVAKHNGTADPHGYCLQMTPTSYLDPTIKQTGGHFWLLAADCDLEVIQGWGPGKICSYEDRPRRKSPPSEARKEGEQ